MLNTSNYTQKLLGLEEVIITKVEKILKQTMIFLELPKKAHVCPSCVSKTIHIHSYRIQKVKALPVFMQNIYLFLRKRRYYCPACHKAFLYQYS